MKIISIGDIHGKSVWNTIDPGEYDKIIFVGDYTDDYYPTTDEQIFENLINIINFKKANPDKVELLYGNHDCSYVYGWSCSGFRSSMREKLFHLFHANKSLFKFAHQEKNYIWTHAGITRFWYDDYFKKIVTIYDLHENNIADQINTLSNSNDGLETIRKVGIIRGGAGYFGGPIWADQREFDEKTILDGYHQIVGHSKTGSGIKKKIYNENTSITFIDCLDTKTEFYEIEI